MPRAKPPTPLLVRSVRMTAAQFAAFDALGGSVWLRNRIDKMNMTGVAKRERNRRMCAAKNMGMSDADIASQFGVDRTTVWRNT
jgi:hypothetical protein